MKKLITALAGLSLLATAAPAMAQRYDRGQPRAGVSLTFSVGDHGRRYYDPYRFNRDRQWRNYNNQWRYRTQYRYVPTCFGDEVAIRSPYNYNRYICVDRDDLNRYNWDR